MTQWSIDLLKAVLDAAPEGIVICEPEGDHAVVYANASFTHLTGYKPEELIGKNLRLLQNNDREQEARFRLRESIARAETTRALVRNYRKDGTAFWNDMVVQAIRDPGGRLACFIGYHRESNDRARIERAAQGLPSWMREDRLTGLASRAYFEELLRRDWAVAQRERRMLGLSIFDVDQLGAYNDTFGRAGGDAVLRRVARLIAGNYRRGSDLVGRWDGGSIAVLSHGTDLDKMIDYANAVAHRVREQLIHHPRASSRYVTVSAGVAALMPEPEKGTECLMRAAESALQRAKGQGRNRLATAQAEDY
jgi:diguanylate cyclase (GGDEF)-like protein/PAS domain S-box-containing protein